MYNSNVKKTYYFRNKDIDCFSFIYDAENNKIISFKKLEGFNFIISYLKTDNLEILKEYYFLIVLFLIQEKTLMFFF